MVSGTSILSYILIFLFLTITLFGGLALIVASFLKKKKWFRYVGAALLIPTILSFVMIASFVLDTQKKEKNILSYSVLSQNYEQAEILLEQGASPDCSFEANEEAKDTEPTLLYLLCDEKSVLPNGNVLTISREARLDMIRFLLEHGANPNKETLHTTSMQKVEENKDEEIKELLEQYVGKTWEE